MEQQSSPQSIPTGAKPRLPGLDLLRLLAIMLVLGRHITGVGGDLRTLPQPVVLFFAAWHRGGWVGVDLFFVLSGFLISGLLFTEWKTNGAISIRRFYIRRAWKIYPAFWMLIAVTVLFENVQGTRVPIQQILTEVFFLQSYRWGIWNHTWSLAVEEHFYALLPIMLAFLLWFNRGSARPLRPVLMISVVIGVLCLAARVLTCKLVVPYDILTHQFPTHLRLDSLMLGVAINYGFTFHTDRFIALLTPVRWPLNVVGSLLLSPAFTLPAATPLISTLGFTVFAIGSGMLLVGTLLCKVPTTRLVVALATLGSFSYSIYLWHMPVLKWLLPYLEGAHGAKFSFLARTGLFVACSLAIGVVMSKLIEVPALRLRDRWFPSRVSAQSAQSARPRP